MCAGEGGGNYRKVDVKDMGRDIKEGGMCDGCVGTWQRRQQPADGERQRK